MDNYWTEPASPTQAEPGQAPQLDEQSAATPPTVPFLSFVGRGSTYFGILFKNLILILLSFGAYIFWAKTNVRRFVWRKTLVYGEPPEYNGTGLEMFSSYVLVATLIYLITFAVLFGSWIEPRLLLTISGVLLLLLSFAVPYARFTALRYRLSRTTWRGIDCYLTGAPLAFAVQTWLRGLLCLLSLGLYTPWLISFVTRYLVKHARFGNHAFNFQNKTRRLLLPFLLAWLLTALSFTLFFYAYGTQEFTMAALASLPAPLAWLYFYVVQLRWKINGLGLQQARLRSRITFFSLFGLLLTNLLLIVCTLGLGLAWARVRWYRYLARRTGIEGVLDFAELQSAIYPHPAGGEGMLSWLNTGLGL